MVSLLLTDRAELPRQHRSIGKRFQAQIFRMQVSVYLSVGSLPCRQQISVDGVFWSVICYKMKLNVLRMLWSHTYICSSFKWMVFRVMWPMHWLKQKHCAGAGHQSESMVVSIGSAFLGIWPEGQVFKHWNNNLVFWSHNRCRATYFDLSVFRSSVCASADISIV